MALGVEIPAQPHLQPLLAEFDQQCGETVSQIGEMFAELEAMRRAVEDRLAELAATRSEEKNVGADRVPRSHWQAAVDERDRLRDELDAANTELARQAVVSSRLAEAKQEVAALKDSLRHERAEAARLQMDAGLADELRARVEETETELDLVRKRGAELAEALAEQRRVTVRERTEWASELKQLRQLLERQSDLLVKRYEALAGDETPERPAAEPNTKSEPRERRPQRNATPPAADAALDSALAQFSQVQRDAQKRRWSKHNGE